MSDQEQTQGTHSNRPPAGNMSDQVHNLTRALEKVTKLEEVLSKKLEDIEIAFEEREAKVFYCTAGGMIGGAATAVVAVKYMANEPTSSELTVAATGGGAAGALIGNGIGRMLFKGKKKEEKKKDS